MPPPGRVGRYPVMREIGSGGMGTVYEAFDPDLDRRIAIKVLAPRMAGDSERLRRFEREARLLASLSHPNIVTIYSVERAETPFLTMELVAGRSLDQLIPDDGLPLDRFFGLALPMCEAVRAAHDRGVVHRDLKPQNVMLSDEGTIKLLDFGLARFDATEDPGRTVEALTADGHLLGTLFYMSPEQARGGQADQRSDVWALGVIFYELLTGERPFKGPHELAVLHSVVHDEPRVPRELRSDLPPTLQGIVGRCLRKSPSDRYPSVQALLEELRAARDAGPAMSRPSTASGETAYATSIAVLPFEVLGSSEAAMFTDGLHSDLLTRLANVAALRVISRTSVRAYRDTAKPIAQIARELDVTWVLEGESRQMGDSVLVNVRLVEAQLDRQVWSQTFRHELSAESVFRIQAEVAERIAADLELRLSPEERSRLQIAPTVNLDAFHLYTQGRRHLDQRTESSLRRGFDLFHQATAADPAYALAWAGMADALCLLDWYHLGQPHGAPGSLEAARRALEIDPDLGQALVSVGIHHAIRMEGPLALRALERAVALAPGYAEAQIWLGWTLLCLGRLEAAVAPARKAVELDPLGPAHHAFLAEILLASGDHDGALVQATRARQIEPDFPLPHYVEGVALHQSGKPRAATRRFERTLELLTARSRPARHEALAGLAVSLLAAGEAERALQVERDIDAEAHPFSAGLLRAAMGDVDGALRHFSRVTPWESFSVELIRGMYPLELGAVRRDPRYPGVIGAVNRAWGLNPDGTLPDEAESSGEKRS